MRSAPAQPCAATSNMMCGYVFFGLQSRPIQIRRPAHHPHIKTQHFTAFIHFKTAFIQQQQANNNNLSKEGLMNTTTTTTTTTSTPAPPPPPAVTLDLHFKGHKESVLCVSVNPADTSLVCSGSEDGTARVWDVRKKSSIRCLHTSHKHPINSVAFAPQPDHPFIYCAEGHNVYCFDLRRPEVVLKEASTIFDYNSEEINQIAISPDGKYLATCDDSGEAMIIDLALGKLVHTLSKRHKNICTSVLFRKGHTQEVLTGGLDCTIVHWNIVRAKHLHQENLATEPKTAQTFNPPMAHSLSMDGEGKCVAAGLGDGSVAIFNLGAWSRTHTLVGHTNSVATVEYAPFAPSTHLFSGGDDSTVALWDLRKNTRYNMHAPKGTSPMILQIQNTSKINHFASSVDRKLFVADQSNHVSVFTING